MGHLEGLKLADQKEFFMFFLLSLSLSPPFKSPLFKSG